jgi:peroxidase
VGTAVAGSRCSRTYYEHTCPQVQAIVAKAHAEDPRMAASSLLRMNFHDCFVQGCDASVLLDADGSSRFVTEKRSNTNSDSLRRFEVIDDERIKRGLN